MLAIGYKTFKYRYFVVLLLAYCSEIWAISLYADEC